MEELKQCLKQECDGGNVYDHIVEIIAKIVVDKPKNALNCFEDISNNIKASKPGSDHVKAQKARSQGRDKLELTWSRQAASMFTVCPEVPADCASISSPVDFSNLLELSGVCIGAEESMLLHLSLQQVARNLKTENSPVRYWGRIRTITGAYYVIEYTSSQDDGNSKVQEGSNGANKQSYFVSTSASGPWKSLPKVTVQQIKAARKIRNLFQGRLDGEVTCYPPFPGNESNYLRAQIARISSSTFVCPVGYYSNVEDSPVPAVRPAESEAISTAYPKQPSELKDLGAWSHASLEINLNGRMIALEAPVDDDEAAKSMPAEDAVDAIPALRSLAEDAGESWSVRVSPGGACETVNSVVVMRSLVWPGAYCATNERKFVNIYVGDGVKYYKTIYSPQIPHAVQSEWRPAEGEADLIEQTEVIVDPTPPLPVEEKQADAVNEEEA